MSWWTILKEVTISEPMNEEQLVSLSRGQPNPWIKRTDRWKNLTKTIFNAPNEQYWVVYGRKGTKEEDKPMAAQGVAYTDGIYLGQGIRNIGEGGKEYAFDIAREVFETKRKKPAILFANQYSEPIFKRLGFKEGTLDDVRELSKEVANNLQKNIPNYQNWNEKLLILR